MQERVEASLGEIERQARALEWNAERPWRLRTHIWAERGLLFVDLHDLSVALAIEAVRRVVELGPPAVAFVTGVGRHSLDGHSRLRDAVHDELSRICDERGASWRMLGPGRSVLLLDPERAPEMATGELPTWFWISLTGLLAGIALKAPLVGGPLLLLVGIAWWWRKR